MPKIIPAEDPKFKINANASLADILKIESELKLESKKEIDEKNAIQQELFNAQKWQEKKEILSLFKLEPYNADFEKFDNILKETSSEFDPGTKKYAEFLMNVTTKSDSINFIDIKSISNPDFKKKILEEISKNETSTNKKTDLEIIDYVNAQKKVEDNKAYNMTMDEKIVYVKDKYSENDSKLISIIDSKKKAIEYNNAIEYGKLQNPELYYGLIGIKDINAKNDALKKEIEILETHITPKLKTFETETKKLAYETNIGKEISEKRKDNQFEISTMKNLNEKLESTINDDIKRILELEKEESEKLRKITNLTTITSSNKLNTFINNSRSRLIKDIKTSRYHIDSYKRGIEQNKRNIVKNDKKLGELLKIKQYLYKLDEDNIKDFATPENIKNTIKEQINKVLVDEKGNDKSYVSFLSTLVDQGKFTTADNISYSDREYMNKFNIGYNDGKFNAGILKDRKFKSLIESKLSSNKTPEEILTYAYAITKVNDGMSYTLTNNEKISYVENQLYSDILKNPEDINVKDAIANDVKSITMIEELKNRIKKDSGRNSSIINGFKKDIAKLEEQKSEKLKSFEKQIERSEENKKRDEESYAIKRKEDQETEKIRIHEAQKTKQLYGY